MVEKRCDVRFHAVGIRTKVEGLVATGYSNLPKEAYQGLADFVLELAIGV